MKERERMYHAIRSYITSLFIQKFFEDREKHPQDDYVHKGYVIRNNEHADIFILKRDHLTCINENLYQLNIIHKLLTKRNIDINDFKTNKKINIIR